MNRKVLKYDGSIEGFFTCIFNAYEQKINVFDILPPGVIQDNMFHKTETILSESHKAQRVYKALKNKISAQGITKLTWAFLSEERGIEMKLYEVVKYFFSTNGDVILDYSNPSVLYISKVAKKVGREKHRMEAFVRFKLTKDDIYFAIIEPDFNVLPIISKHFTKRYADQKWIIYDLKRKFGLYYDLIKTEYISMELPEDIGISGANLDYFSDSEIYFQKLWKEYFHSTNIKSRANMRLHVQHVPKRYWKYLSEKSPFA